jgi:hypothetical protein
LTPPPLPPSHLAQEVGHSPHSRAGYSVGEPPHGSRRAVGEEVSRVGIAGEVSGVDHVPITLIIAGGDRGCMRVSSVGNGVGGGVGWKEAGGGWSGLEGRRGGRQVGRKGHEIK